MTAPGPAAAVVRSPSTTSRDANPPGSAGAELPPVALSGWASSSGTGHGADGGRRPPSHRSRQGSALASAPGALRLRYGAPDPSNSANRQFNGPGSQRGQNNASKGANGVIGRPCCVPGRKADG